MIPVNNQKDIENTYFENKLLDKVGIEVMSIDNLREKLSSDALAKPERIYFYMMIFVTRGKGIHTVDFKQRQIEAGTLVVVRPGQIQQWQADGNYSATLILIEPSALPYWGELFSVNQQPHLKLLGWQTFSTMPKALSNQLDAEMDRLNTDLNCFDETDIDISLIRHQIFVILLRIARWQRTLLFDKGIKAEHHHTYSLFIRQLEENFRQQHSLQFYAKRLGYSCSTISRACHAAEGYSAKLVIDKRIALEAQRMLAHSQLSTTEIAYELGFSETTNFVRFFKRLVGSTPTKFRDKI